MVSMVKPPIIKYKLDFGAVALGGSYSARLIKGFIDPFITETLASMLVWPARLVVSNLRACCHWPLGQAFCKRLAQSCPSSFGRAEQSFDWCSLA